jgi:hypothetical protein
MKIASQHAKAVSKRTWICVEERLLLNGIALHSSDVSPRDVEFPALVVADLAHPGLPLCNRTAVSAGVATKAVALNGFVQLAFADILIQDFAER